MVRLRLRRVGAKGQPSYRIVVTDSRTPRDGRYIEMIGFYNPRTEPAAYEVNEERALYWLNQGAQPSDSVRRILSKMGTIDRYERLRAGEPLETLLAEAEAAAAARPAANLRTRRDDAHQAPKKTKAGAKTQPVAEVGEAVEETAEE
jgi:small subunit ribosomal protein S16